MDDGAATVQTLSLARAFLDFSSQMYGAAVAQLHLT